MLRKISYEHNKYVRMLRRQAANGTMVRMRVLTRVILTDERR